MKIVVIEDDAVVADTLALYLQQAGFEVVTARDGATGLQLASAADAGLVVLDLMIPGLTGLDVCRRLRASSTIPIVMLTARVAEADRLAGFDAGADDYVPKPFSPKEVVARVQAVLRRTAPAAPTAPTPIAIGDLQIDLWARQVRLAGRAVALSRRPRTRRRAPGSPRDADGAGSGRFPESRPSRERDLDEPGLPRAHPAGRRRGERGGAKPIRSPFSGRSRPARVRFRNRRLRWRQSGPPPAASARRALGPVSPRPRCWRGPDAVSASWSVVR